jgi:hypothetical protein
MTAYYEEMRLIEDDYYRTLRNIDLEHQVIIIIIY